MVHERRRRALAAERRDERAEVLEHRDPHLVAHVVGERLKEIRDERFERAARETRGHGGERLRDGAPHGPNVVSRERAKRGLERRFGVLVPRRGADRGDRARRRLANLELLVPGERDEQRRESRGGHLRSQNRGERAQYLRSGDADLLLLARREVGDLRQQELARVVALEETGDGGHGVFRRGHHAVNVVLHEQKRHAQQAGVHLVLLSRARLPKRLREHAELLRDQLPHVAVVVLRELLDEVQRERLLANAHRTPAHLAQASHVEVTLHRDGTRAAVLRAELELGEPVRGVLIRRRLRLVHVLLVHVGIERRRVTHHPRNRSSRAHFPPRACSIGADPRVRPGVFVENKLRWPAFSARKKTEKKERPPTYRCSGLSDGSGSVTQEYPPVARSFFGCFCRLLADAGVVHVRPKAIVIASRRHTIERARRRTCLRREFLHARASETVVVRLAPAALQAGGTGAEARSIEAFVIAHGPRNPC